MEKESCTTCTHLSSSQPDTSKKRSARKVGNLVKAKCGLAKQYKNTWECENEFSPTFYTFL